MISMRKNNNKTSKQCKIKRTKKLKKTTTTTTTTTNRKNTHTHRWPLDHDNVRGIGTWTLHRWLAQWPDIHVINIIQSLNDEIWQMQLNTFTTQSFMLYILPIHFKYHYPTFNALKICTWYMEAFKNEMHFCIWKHNTPSPNQQY
jgi:hypothetical protein